MFGVEKLDNKLANLVREGTVSVVYPEKHSARVIFENKERLISAELPVLTTFASKNKAYNLPDVGERVVCIMASNNSSGGGYIIGSLYNTEHTPPADCYQDVTKIEFADEAFISYDRAAHNFRIQFSDDSFINFDGEHGELEIYCKGFIIIEGEKRLEITTKDEILIDSKADVEVTGRNIRLN